MMSRAVRFPERETRLDQETGAGGSITMAAPRGEHRWIITVPEVRRQHEQCRYKERKAALGLEGGGGS